ncbi:MAG: hypothetical protein ABI467_11400 [Kofleriaceae bacterium]
MRLLLVALAVVGCSKASDEASAKKWQAQPPFKEMAPPPGLSIAVAVDGAARPPITAITLESKPDFEDSERKAWLISHLVPEAAPAGTVIEASSPGGVSLKLAHPTADGLEPVLFLTRRGEIVVSTVDPKQPFPGYHGKGGRLHRAGDSMPRLTPVAKLVITRATPN